MIKSRGQGKPENEAKQRHFRRMTDISGEAGSANCCETSQTTQDKYEVFCNNIMEANDNKRKATLLPSAMTVRQYGNCPHVLSC